MEKRKYPHFIQNKPCGIDKFEGGSQKRLANAIVNQIIDTDEALNEKCLPRIIGLEGGWGVGKSNVIQLIKTRLIELDKSYHIFEYDAWGHQEDLQRRSFIETLTKELIDEKILIGKTEDEIDGKTKKITWKEKLDNLLARRVLRINKSIPKFNAGALWTAIALSLTPITVFIAERLEATNTVTCILYLILIAFFPIIIGILLWLIFMYKNKEMRSLGYLLKISKDENVETRNYETINEDEPNVTKFKAWMDDVSKSINDNHTKKLIIVFDNMDRLPADKVKELWSSIHTFFSDGGFDNIWVVIPFDEKHLACAFDGDNTDENKELASHFINKTFPVVYRVAPPVITDLKAIFDNLFLDAFGKTEIANQESINRIFRLVKPYATVREIILFINQLVALKNIWGNEIEILYMAIFLLKKEEILKDPINHILSGDYLDKNIKKFTFHDEALQKNISALVYEVDTEYAAQIPLKKYIEHCINLDSGYDINTYFIQNKQFVHILDDVVRDVDDVLIDNVIANIPQLKLEELQEKDREIVTRLWKYISKQKLSIHLPKQKFEESFKTLILNVDLEDKNKIVKFLCEEFKKFKEFGGSNYYQAMLNLEDFLLKSKIDISLEISDINVSPEIFIEYMCESKDNYPKYKLKTDPKKLDDYYVGLLPDRLEKTGVIYYLKTNKEYSFPKLTKGIENIITEGNVIAEDFNQIFYTYKTLSDKKPLSVQLNSTNRQNLLNAFSQKPESEDYCELVAMCISSGTNVPSNLKDVQLKNISDCIEYYATYGNMLINNISWNISSLNQVLKHMTLNKIGTTLSIEEILPRFFDIKNKLGITEEELLTQLNRWNKVALKAINKDNIETLFPNPQFFQYSTTIKNELTNNINKIAVEKLKEIDDTDLYNQRNNHNDYWVVVLKYLLSAEFIKQLPDNLTEFGKKILKDIANGTQAMPVPDLFQQIADKLDDEEIGSTIKDIRDDFFATRVITPQQFQYFESWFETQGDFMGTTAGSVVRRIIRSVINDTACWNIILSKQGFYSQVINKAGNEANDLKEDIRKKMQNSTDENLIAFAKSIGIEKSESNE